MCGDKKKIEGEMHMADARGLAVHVIILCGFMQNA